MTTERGILFNGPMVRATLDGRKTETRRLIVPQPTDGGNGRINWSVRARSLAGGDPQRLIAFVPCPYGQPGDLLYVRETWGEGLTYGGGTAIVWFAADGQARFRERMPVVCDYAAPPKDLRWRPSIHMPKRAARIWLRVEDVWVERVQDITEAGAIAEGFEANPYYMADGTLDEAMSISARANYAIAIDKIYPGAWGRNDWMWGCRFSRTEAPHA